MEITLEKIELVKDRTGVTYKEAKEALEACDGNVVDAIVFIEEKVNDEVDTEINIECFAGDLVEKLKALVRKGNVTKISITKEDKPVVNIPVNAGIIGVALAPWTMLIGAIVAYGTSCKIAITTDDGKVIDVSSKVQVGVDYAKEKGEKAWNFAKEKAPEAWDFAKEQGEKAWDYAKEKAPEAWDFAKDKGEKAWDYAKEKAPEAWEFAKEKGEDVWKYAKEQLDERKVNKAEKLFDNIEILDDDNKLGKEDEK